MENENKHIHIFWLTVGKQKVTKETETYKKSFTGEIGVSCSKDRRGGSFVTFFARFKHISVFSQDKGFQDPEATSQLFLGIVSLGKDTHFERLLGRLVSYSNQIGLEAMQVFSQDLLIWSIQNNEDLAKEVRQWCPTFVATILK